MARVLFWGKLSKIPPEEKINLIFEVLIPASYLKAVNGGNTQEFKKIDSYKKEVEKLLKNSDLEEYKKQEITYKLKHFDFVLGEI